MAWLAWQMQSWVFPKVAKRVVDCTSWKACLDGVPSAACRGESAMHRQCFMDSVSWKACLEGVPSGACRGWSAGHASIVVECVMGSVSRVVRHALIVVHG